MIAANRLFEWRAGGDKMLSHRRKIDAGASSGVHEVSQPCRAIHSLRDVALQC